jgi:hypothetical protein
VLTHDLWAAIQTENTKVFLSIQLARSMMSVDEVIGFV